MDKLVNYCVNKNCESGHHDCDMCMYQKGIDDMVEAIKLRLLRFIPTDFDDIEAMAAGLKGEIND